MALRTSMDTLVNHLRSLTNAAVSETFHGIVYWTDEQLETNLDAHSILMRQIPLRADRVTVSSATDVTHQIFTIPPSHWVESNTIEVRNGNGVLTTTAYTLNVDRVSITFSAAPTDTQWYITARFHDMWQAAAAVWEQKASHRHDFIAWRTGQHRADRRQEYDHCMRMAALFRGRLIRGHSRRKSHYVVTPSTRLEVRPGG